MKLFSLSLSAFLALTLFAGAQATAPVGPGSVKMGKIQPAVVKTPEFNLSSGPTKRSKLGDWIEVEVEYETKPEDIDELTFKFTLFIEKKILEGEVTYVDIPKGRDHYAVVYVSPRSLEKLTGGKPLTASSIENVWVEVSKQGLVIDKGSFKPGAVPNAMRLPNYILTKDQTPFAPLFFDRYEAIKKTR